LAHFRPELRHFGDPEKVIQLILRHANVATTNTYHIKAAPAQVTSAMEKLEQSLPESLSGNETAEQVQEEVVPESLSGNARLERRGILCR
jgi:hypothetical protein